MLKEFKEFIARGSVIDMAVGLVMGAAFKSIIESFVADIIMPLISLLTAGRDFTKLKIILKEARVVDGEQIEEVALRYGNVIQTIITFILIAFVIFLMIKGINRVHDKAKAKKEEAVAAEKVAQKELLEEIRDLLKKKI